MCSQNEFHTLSVCSVERRQATIECKEKRERGRKKKKQMNWINNKKQIKLINTKNKQCKNSREIFVFAMSCSFRIYVRIAIAKSEEDNDDDDVLTPFAYLQSAIACIVNVHKMDNAKGWTFFNKNLKKPFLDKGKHPH